MKRDGQGNVVENAFFGTDGRPCLCKKGFAMGTTKYDRCGNAVEEVFLARTRSHAFARMVLPS